MAQKKNTTDFVEFIVVDEDGENVLDSSPDEKVAMSDAKDELATAYENEQKTQVAVYKLVAVFEVDENNPPMPPIDRIY